MIFRDDARRLWLYHGNCLELLDAIAAKYPEGRFDAIFADPPYFLSNGGITCHAGKMVKVNKGDWDRSRGPELNHEFNLEWLGRCQRVLKPNGTIWVSGTHHVIFSIGYAMQQLGYKILNDIAWEKPNPPPNLSCRYFTHSTETVLWAAKNEKSKHVFNYAEMRKVTGKQMKTVWRKEEFRGARASGPHPAGVSPGDSDDSRENDEASSETLDAATETVALPTNLSSPSIRASGGRAGEGSAEISDIWTMSAPGSDEKEHGKHPTQKPVALIERCLLASTNEGDLVLDPFIGGGTTAIATIKLKRGCVGIELDSGHAVLASRRIDGEIISIWLRCFRVRVEFFVTGSAGLWPASGWRPARRLRGKRRSIQRDAERGDRAGRAPQQIDLDLFSETINGSRHMAETPPIETERIYHETKFVFLSCAEVERGSVVHTTVDVSLQEAWAKTPTGKKRETTHVVRCETEIFRVKNG